MRIARGDNAGTDALTTTQVPKGRRLARNSGDIRRAWTFRVCSEARQLLGVRTFRRNEPRDASTRRNARELIKAPVRELLKDSLRTGRFVCMSVDSGMSERSDESIPTRASLLGRLKNWEDQDSWEDFVRTYSRLIRGFAIQSGLSDEEAKEAEQETLLCVAKTIHQFESDPARGTFKAWLLKLTRWRIADQFRKRSRESAWSARSGGPEDTSTLEEVPDDGDQEALWAAEWRKSILETAVARVGRRLKPKHYQAFDLYAIRKWPPAQVARELGVSVVQVYLIHHRVIKLVRKEVAYLEAKLH